MPILSCAIYNKLEFGKSYHLLSQQLPKSAILPKVQQKALTSGWQFIAKLSKNIRDLYLYR
ncbi:hypothetical protein TI03_02280 [Achromatium sp. WMS1]|nr:hypothetical protein TI03_02280 [Achromatium sp. WMS1]